jgi:hypothetical protein
MPHLIKKMLAAFKKFQNPKHFIFMCRPIYICQKTELKSCWTALLKVQYHQILYFIFVSLILNPFCVSASGLQILSYVQ